MRFLRVMRGPRCSHCCRDISRCYPWRPYRLHAHARRRRRAPGAAPGVGAVGVGLRKLGDDAGQELDEVGGGEEAVGALLCLDGFGFSEFLRCEPYSILVPTKIQYEICTIISHDSRVV